MYKRKAVSVNYAAEMWTEGGVDYIALTFMNLDTISTFVRVNPPNGSWAKATRGDLADAVTQDLNLMLSIMWFQGR